MLIRKSKKDTRFKKGQDAWNKGKPAPWAKNLPQRFIKGQKLSEEVKKKISQTMKGKNAGEKNPFYGEKPPKAYSFPMGEKHPNWNGGSSFLPYTTDWTNTLKNSIRERDHYVCRLCGTNQTDRLHSVHHIDYNKNNCDPKNLITLCIKCHIKTNKNRNYWIKHLNELF